MKLSHLFQTLLIFTQLLLLCIISIFSIYKFIVDENFRTISHFLVAALTIGCTTFLARLYFTKVLRIKFTKK